MRKGVLYYLTLYIWGVEALTRDLCIVGGTSGLGKELVYQSVIQRNMSVLALSSSPPTDITYPTRTNSFYDMKHRDVFHHDRLLVGNYWHEPATEHDYEHLVFATKAPPFRYDYTVCLMRDIFADLPPSCKSVTWIAPPDEWYMDNSVRGQAPLIADLSIKTFIFRPKALANDGDRATLTRKRLARRILMNIENINIFY